ncbi:putative vacuolar sorting-associated protein 13 [Spironucleus salmonicida]|uniref:Vacuolar sorting-associated protein 13 n=1 Tax=Spironucleus salmonicida TaxID=348837 RepID=V6LCB8_9EUKA|nr:putative vacuolar sorting-associated protein 13 [Spironucleus salmonicida]|eukprot:EST42117.1 hypothetical protein SS50377_18426 [Spironucleus salmonicida]
MLESLIVNKLQDLATKYLDNFDKNMLNISIGKGDVEIRNLSLKSDALSEVLPGLGVKAGFLSKLNLKFSITKLKTEPIQVFIEDLLILAVSKDELELDTKTLQDQLQLKIKEKIKHVFQAELFEEEKIANGDKAGKKSKFVSGLINSVLNNLKIQIKNFHIRFENQKRQLCVGLAVESISIDTVQIIKDEGTIKEIPIVLKEDVTILSKRLQLQSMSLYIDNSFECLSNCKEKNEVKQFLLKNIATNKQIPSFSYVIHPMSVKLIVNYDKTENNFQFMGPKFSVTASVSNCNFNISCLQLAKTLHQAKELSKIIIVGHIENRPSQPILSEPWWSYMLLDTYEHPFENRLMYPLYCSLYAQHYINFKTKFATQKQQDAFDREGSVLLDQKQKELMILLQQQFSEQELIFCKGLVLRQLVGENFQKLKKAEFKFSVRDEEIDQQIMQQNGVLKKDEYPVGFKLLDVCMKFNDIQVALNDSQTDQQLVRLVLTSVQVDLKKQQPDVIKCGLLIGNFELFDLSHGVQRYNTLIRKLPHNPQNILQSIKDIDYKESNSDILFAFSFVMPNVDNYYCGTLELDSQPLSIVLTSELLEMLVLLQQQFAVFQNQEKQEIMNEQTQLEDKFSQIQDYSANALKLSKQNHKRIQIQLSLNGSMIIFPTKQEQYIVINLGRFLFQTIKQQDKNSFYDEYELFMNNTSIFSLQNNLDFTELVSFLYQLNQNSVSNNDQSNEKFDLFKPFNCKINFIRSILSNYVSTTRFQVHADLSQINLNINDYNCQVIYNIYQEMFNKKKAQNYNKDNKDEDNSLKIDYQDQSEQQLSEKILKIQDFIVLDLQIQIQQLKLVLGNFLKQQFNPNAEIILNIMQANFCHKVYDKQVSLSVNDIIVNDLITNVKFFELQKGLYVDLKLKDKNYDLDNRQLLNFDVQDLMFNYQPQFILKIIDLLLGFSKQIFSDNQKSDSQIQLSGEKLKTGKNIANISRVNAPSQIIYNSKINISLNSVILNLYTYDKQLLLNSNINKLQISLSQKQSLNVILFKIQSSDLNYSENKVNICSSLDNQDLFDLQLVISKEQIRYDFDVEGKISGVTFYILKLSLLDIVQKVQYHIKQVYILLSNQQKQKSKQIKKQQDLPLIYIACQLNEINVIIPESIKQMDNFVKVSIQNTIIRTQPVINFQQNFSTILNSIIISTKEDLIINLQMLQLIAIIDMNTQNKKFQIKTQSDIILNIKDNYLINLTSVMNQNLLFTNTTIVEDKQVQQLQTQFDSFVYDNYSQIKLRTDNLDFETLLEPYSQFKTQKKQINIRNILSTIKQVSKQEQTNITNISSFEFSIDIQSIQGSIKIDQYYYKIFLNSFNLTSIIDTKKTIYIQTDKIKLHFQQSEDQDQKPVFSSRGLYFTLISDKNNIQLILDIRQQLFLTINPQQIYNIGKFLLKQKQAEDYKDKKMKQLQAQQKNYYQDMQAQFQIITVDISKINNLGIIQNKTLHSNKKIEFKINLLNTTLSVIVSSTFQFYLKLNSSINLQILSRLRQRFSKSLDIKKYVKDLTMITDVCLMNISISALTGTKVNEIIDILDMEIATQIKLQDQFIYQDQAIDSNIFVKIKTKSQQILFNLGIGSILQIIEQYNLNNDIFKVQLKYLTQLQDSILNKTFYESFQSIQQHKNFQKTIIPSQSNQGQPAIIGHLPYCTFCSLQDLQIEVQCVKIQIVFFDRQVTPQPLFVLKLTESQVSLIKFLNRYQNIDNNNIQLYLFPILQSYNQNNFYFDKIIDINKLEISINQISEKKEQCIVVDELQVNLNPSITSNVQQVYQFTQQINSLIKNLENTDDTVLQLVHDRILLVNSTNYIVQVQQFGTTALIHELLPYSQNSIDKFNNEFTLLIIENNTILKSIDIQINQVELFSSLLDDLFFQIINENGQLIYIFRYQKAIYNLSHLKISIQNQNQFELQQYINSFNDTLIFIFEEQRQIVKNLENIQEIQISPNKFTLVKQNKISSNHNELINYYLHPTFIVQNLCQNILNIDAQNILPMNYYYIYTTIKQDVKVQKLSYQGYFQQYCDIVSVFMLQSNLDYKNQIVLNNQQSQSILLNISQDKSFTHYQSVFKIYPQFMIQNLFYLTNYQVYIVISEKVIDLTGLQFVELLGVNTIHDARLIVQQGKDKKQWNNIHIQKIKSKQKFSEDQLTVTFLKSSSITLTSTILTIQPEILIRNQSNYFFNYYFCSNDNKNDIYPVLNSIDKITPIFVNQQYIYLQYEENSQYSSIIDLSQKCSLCLFIPGLNQFISIQTFHQSGILIIDIFNKTDESDAIKIINLTSQQIQVQQQLDFTISSKNKQKMCSESMSKDYLQKIMIEQNSESYYQLYDVQLVPVIQIFINDKDYVNVSLTKIGKRKPIKINNITIFISLDCHINTKIIKISFRPILDDTVLQKVWLKLDDKNIYTKRVLTFNSCTISVYIPHIEFQNNVNQSVQNEQLRIFISNTKLAQFIYNEQTIVSVSISHISIQNFISNSYFEFILTFALSQNPSFMLTCTYQNNTRHFINTVIQIQPIILNVEQTLYDFVFTIKNIIFVQNAIPNFAQTNTDLLDQKLFIVDNIIGKPFLLKQKKLDFSQVYFGNFQINQIELTVSFSLEKIVLSQTRTINSLLSTVIDPFMHLSDIRILLPSFTISNKFISLRETITEFQKFYFPQLISNVSSLISGTELPASIQRAFEPFDNCIDDIHTDAKNLKFLPRKLQISLTNSIFAFPASVARILEILTFDGSFKARQLKLRRMSEKHPKLAVKNAFLSLKDGFIDGIYGVVKQPQKGLSRQGKSGLAKGIGKGIIGILLKPASGITSMIACLGMSCGNQQIKELVHRKQWRQGIDEEESFM